MPNMPDGLAALLWGIVTFSLLILIHEGGHFLAARFFGRKVHEFMVGLPGPALRFHGKKTTYGITAIPFGGYVRVAGMEPGPEDPLLGPVLAAITRHGSATAAQIALELDLDEEEVEGALVILADWDALEQPSKKDGGIFHARFDPGLANDPGALLDQARSVTYRALPVWKRTTMLCAGPAVNLIVAVLVFTVVVSSYGVLTTKISEVASGSAAEEAGIVAQDRITRIGDKKIGSWNSLVTEVAKYDAGESIDVGYERDGATKTVKVALKENPETKTGFLGVSPSLEKPTLVQALAESMSYVGLTFSAVLQFFNPRTAGAALSQSSSVIGASYMAAGAARQGALQYASLVAMLSLSLGVVNVFPIPPLDGGKIAIEVVQRFRKRELPRNLTLGLSAAGAVLLFALIGYLVCADIVKYIIR
ncbi:MAG: site-2 protease family protein [Coriobacteriia bacterium]|nr:site-2 protease family protein [Coriobacteriia bacterium]